MTIRKSFVLGAVAGVAILACAAVMWTRQNRRQSASIQKPPAPTAQRPAPIPAPATAPPVSGEKPSPLPPAPTPPPPAPPMRDADVAAKVNGEPIYRREVDAGVDDKMFPGTMDQAREARLNRLIDIVAIRQYLARQGIKIPDDAVEREVKDMKENPPASGGCSCCRYDSLDAFLAANTLTLDDLRWLVRNDMGLNRNVDDLWNVEYPAGDKRQAFLDRERTRIEGAYFKIAHVFFNVAQQPGYASDPDLATEKATKKAKAAWERIQKGEAFAAVAKACSEDKITGAQGGALGCIPRSAFGREVEKAAAQLKPGQTGAPVESAWGVHIVRREAMNDADVLATLQSEYRNRKLQSLMASIRAGARVELPERGNGRGGGR